MDANPKVIHKRMTNKSDMSAKTASHYVISKFKKNKRLTVMHFKCDNVQYI